VATPMRSALVIAFTSSVQTFMAGSPHVAR
jgi:hypothetical protein